CRSRNARRRAESPRLRGPPWCPGRKRRDGFPRLEVEIHAMAVEYPAWIERRLEPAQYSQQRFSRALERTGGLVGGTVQRGVAGVLARPQAQPRRIGLRVCLEPAQATAPFEQLRSAEGDKRRGGAQREPPQRQVGIGGEKRVPLLAQRRPE